MLFVEIQRASTTYARARCLANPTWTRLGRRRNSNVVWTWWRVAIWEKWKRWRRHAYEADGDGFAFSAFYEVICTLPGTSKDVFKFLVSIRESAFFCLLLALVRGIR